MSLGNVCQSVSEYEKAREYSRVHLLIIIKEIGDRNGEATCYTNLATVCRSVGEYEKAREYLEKSLVLFKKMGGRNGEAACYTNRGPVCQSVGEYEKARPSSKLKCVFSNFAIWLKRPHN